MIMEKNSYKFWRSKRKKRDQIRLGLQDYISTGPTNIEWKAVEINRWFHMGTSDEVF